jgi:hypothetical protein
MSRLIDLTELNAENFMELLKDSEIIVYENIQGSKIFFNFDEDLNVTLRARSVKSQNINRVDLALQKYYNRAFNYLESLDNRVKKLLPNDWWFCCQYFYDSKPSHLEYDNTPKNNLILTSIVKEDYYTFDLDEITEFANLMEIDPQPVLFKGVLNEKQLELINYFLHTQSDDLDYVFGDDNFASFFYKILNPSMKSSLLMKDGEFQDNIDKLIIKIDNNDEISLSILNPLYMKTENGKSEHVDTYTILLSDFLEYLQSINIERTFLHSKTNDELYLELISNLFNNYCEERENKIVNFIFNIPPFFYEDKFKINTDLIKNTQTRHLINKSDKLEYMFKIILNSFRTRKKKPIGVFNEKTIQMFNDMVDRIQKHIDKILRIESEEVLKGTSLLDFEHFYDIKYPKDAAGDVYPDLYKELDDEVEGGDKKKKKGYSKKKGFDGEAELF